MENSKKVELYIKKHNFWEKELSSIRNIINQTDLKEEIKWNVPHYTLNGKIILGLGAFKNHIAIWFHQGVFLKDTHKKLINSQEEKTRALRQWRFIKGDIINKKLILEYTKEAIENCLSGKELKSKSKTDKIIIPAVLRDALDKDPFFTSNFTKLTPGKQREYTSYINEAKREKTKLSRLEKSVNLINQGKGLHDKYRKS